MEFTGRRLKGQSLNRARAHDVAPYPIAIRRGAFVEKLDGLDLRVIVEVTPLALGPLGVEVLLQVLPAFANENSLGDLGVRQARGIARVIRLGRLQEDFTKKRALRVGRAHRRIVDRAGGIDRVRPDPGTEVCGCSLQQGQRGQWHKDCDHDA